LEGLGVDERMVIKMDFKERKLGAWTRLIWLRKR
jgi:hypothetical protein